jgi:predicted site-specific integrase-resolvase
METEVVIINKSTEELSFEQELVQDMIELVTVFSARLYGSRSHKNKKLIDGISNVIDEVK